MNEQSFFETRLSTHLNNLVYDRMIMCFHRNPGQALGAEFVRRNAFYAKVLSHLLRHEEPTFASFANVDEREDPEVLFQNGLYLYHKWVSLGLSGAIFNYCQMMNRLIAKTVLSQADHSKLELPDLCNDARAIEAYVHQISAPVHAKGAARRALKIKFEKLAVNA